MLKILCTAEFDKDYINFLSEFAEVRQRGFSVNMDFREMLTKEELIKELEDIDIFIVGYDKVTDEVLRSAPDLKLVLSVRDGPEENIDVKACKELGIPILFSSGRCVRSVSEQTMLLILASARPVIYANSLIYNGKWSKETLTKDPDTYYAAFKPLEQSHEISGKTLGIVGIGRNGLALAQRAKAFDMNLIAYDPYADKAKADALGIQLVDLMTLMSSSDYVSILARLLGLYILSNAVNASFALIPTFKRASCRFSPPAALIFSGCSGDSVFFKTVAASAACSMISDTSFSVFPAARSFEMTFFTFSTNPMSPSSSAPN